MSPHPKFDLATSNCHNCLAFDHTWKACHRFAPRAAHIRFRMDDEGNTVGSPEYSDHLQWPVIDDDFWCLDWLPAASPLADESRWHEFHATLSVRAKNALHRAGLGSFAQLDVVPDRDLGLLPGVGVTTLREVREKRKSFSGGAPA